MLYPAELLDLCIPTLLTECIFVAGYRKLDAMFIRSKKTILTTLITATARQRYKKLSLLPKSRTMKVRARIVSS
ncbi:hypothetical protein PORUE0001_0061 [Porphyromonas uenonis 60-3]|uniref:Uncharacterized protein n=1 Tax=Porphyromonas uenonis 60-3 TaxID=596327 RepID=C2MB85_9PORP|nr:hypothetical protein PORUE0001_0061 [Porphyromonas uenonis 60-3]